MENSMLTDIIKREKIAPLNLNKLSDEFLAIEANYNSTVEELGREKSRIQQACDDSLSRLKGEHDKKVLDAESAFKDGKYATEIILMKAREWRSNESKYRLMMWGAVVVGVLFLFFVKWYLGFLIGGIGYFIFSVKTGSANKIFNQLNGAEKLTSTSKRLDLDAISNISSDVKAAIEAGVEKARLELESLKNSLADEYKTMVDKESHDLEQTLAEFIKKQRKTISELINTSNNKIEEINSNLGSITNDLNQLPETFNNNLLKWTDESILKAQEMVSYNLRVGQETIRIEANKPHTIVVPHCIPFFNSSNIVINCTNQEEIERAIQITHNIIARTLLTLPPNKIKITFVDPVKLGGNAAPFTPLVKDIYGGRIFTQADDIENQLDILTRAIESIIQHYLQDKFPDIATYNQETKEVPEPYRLLVVYNFPHGFNDTSAKKLLNVISSGPKAGIHTVLVNDRNAELPYGLGKSGWDAFRDGFSEIVLNPDNPYIGAAPANEQFGLNQSAMAIGHDKLYKEITNLRGHSNNMVRSVAFSPDGQSLASAGDVSPIKIWSESDGEWLEVGSLGQDEWVSSVAYSPDGKLLASVGLRNIPKIWSLTDQREIATLTGHSTDSKPHVVAFSPDGKLLAMGGQKCGVTLWNLANREGVASLTGNNSNSVHALAFSPDGKLLASGGYDQSLKLWSVGKWQEVACLIGHGYAVLALAFSPDGRLLASGGTDGCVKLWSVADWREVATLPEDRGYIQSLAFSSDGKLLAIGGMYNILKIWSVAELREVANLTDRDDNSIFSVAFSPDGRLLASGGKDCSVKLWELNENEMKKMVRGNATELVLLAQAITENEKKEAVRGKRYKFDSNLPFKEIVDFVNKEFPNVNTLKVPFTKYVDDKSDWWKGKAHKQFSVPIGRHGADVQVLQLDNDDDNQALLIGKPGSGKSNLLHVIIANSLWKYSPDQLEIYLIDFKGGVEFTIYADKKIPHIRTIAIESEREFGLSVLDGVEKELLKREKEFSRVGISKLNEYHEKFPSERMPRILLIVDEFQEFYTEDDDIKQSVDAKFDRIIKKGRAFGINTLFSSQTLSGNSIQKSTRELIDIRIALMCSDTDANQILDDRNPAARDLTRPGEGIYNPDNGKVSGNYKFQAFFVEKEELHRTIEEVVTFAKSQPPSKTPFKQIIFRGSEKAHIEKEGHPLVNVKTLSNPKSITLWLGEPVAIADDVTATIRKQGGSNLLVAGYDEGTGLRVMASSVISIAAQHQQDTAKFYYFNFFNIDSELVNAPHELFNNIQHQSENVGSRDVKNALQAIKDDIEKRLLEGTSNNPNIYLAFFSFQRGRAFRKDGYTMSGEGDLLSYILKEGPDVGVFTMVQVDTMDNFSKNLDDNLLREFSQRVASQMNPDNSVKIIGNQKASKLSNNRAWYYDDNENTLTKFKPYELPSYSWVLQLQNKNTVVLS